MKLGDIFFAIGIILISSLLVFVVYDDITNPYPYPNIMDENIEINDTEEYNVTEKDLSLVPSSSSNNTVVVGLNLETKTSSAQGSGNAVVSQKLNKANTQVQSAGSQKNNVNNEVEHYSGDSKYSEHSNTPNDNNNRQYEPVTPQRQESGQDRPMF